MGAWRRSTAPRHGCWPSTRPTPAVRSSTSWRVRIWRRSASGELKQTRSGKVSTREGTLLAELAPTPKIIASLRDWYPQALIVGWKYEVDGNRQSVIAAAQRQLSECRTNACVANGKAYGEGFGVVQAAGDIRHVETAPELFACLADLLKTTNPGF